MRIAITGSHNTGKTSLLKKLWPSLEFEGYDFYKEVIREIYKLGFPFNENADDSSQLAMLALHLLHLKSENMITDRCILDNYVYAYMLRDKGYDISDECVDTLQAYFVDSIKKYDIYAFCPTEFEIKKDGFRMTDKKFQEEISNEILKVINLYIPPSKFILLHGETDERIKQLLEFKKTKEKLNA